MLLYANKQIQKALYKNLRKTLIYFHSFPRDGSLLVKGGGTDYKSCPTHVFIGLNDCHSFPCCMCKMAIMKRVANSLRRRQRAT